MGAIQRASVINLYDGTVLAYYCKIVLRGFVDGRNRIQTITLMEYVFTASAMLVINARDFACHSYYTYNPLFENETGGLLFSLFNKIFGVEAFWPK